MSLGEHEELCRLEAILSSGITENTEDGQTTKFDLTAIRQRVRELKRKLGLVPKQNRFRTIRLDQ